MSTDKPRFTITIDEELFKRLEDYRFENRCQNRTKTVVELIRQSLDAYDKRKKKDLNILPALMRTIQPTTIRGMRTDISTTEVSASFFPALLPSVRKLMWGKLSAPLIPIC